MIVGFCLVAAYVAVGIYTTKFVRGLAAQRPIWVRNLAGAVVLTIFFAPTLVGAGHGVGMAPAWVALVDPESSGIILKIALQAMILSGVIFFIVGVVVDLVRKHPKNQ
jgi:xanthine/uracil/vitamin C permease (AzgA family)